MDREELDDWLAKALNGVVLLALFYAPLAMGAVLPRHFVGLQALAALGLVLWAVRIWVRPRARLYWPPTCWAVLGFVAYAGYSYATADIEYIARLEWLKIAVYAAFFFIVLNNLYRQESAQLVTYTLLLVGLGISLYAVLQFITGSEQIWSVPQPEQYHGRASGTYINPNHLAGFLEVILPLGLAYVVSGRLGHVTRIVLVYATAFLVAGIAVTISRGGWMAAGLALAVFFGVLLWRPGYRIPAIVALVVLISAGVWFVGQAPSLKERFGRMIVAGKVENVRFYLWGPAWEMWRDHPWVGVGPAHFDYRFAQYRPERVQASPDRVHNDFLNTLADYGVIGLALISLVWAGTAWGAALTWRSVRRSPDDFGAKQSNRSAFVLGASIGLLALWLHSWVDFNLHIPANALVAVILMGLLAAHWRYAFDRYGIRLRWAMKAIVSLVCLAGAAYLGAEGIKRIGEVRALQRAADHQSRSLDQEIAALKRAFEIEPMNHRTAYDIGERLRQLSWQGRPGYREVAERAAGWFERSIALNPYDYFSYVRRGMCLDWIGRHEEAARCFEEAEALDPRGYWTLARVGWHYLQVEDYEKAQAYLERSLELKPRGNSMAEVYLRRIDQWRKEGARAS